MPSSYAPLVLPNPQHTRHRGGNNEHPASVIVGRLEDGLTRRCAVSRRTGREASEFLHSALDPFPDCKKHHYLRNILEATSYIYTEIFTSTTCPKISNKEN
jgi:hypothetical protein